MIFPLSYKEHLLLRTAHKILNVLSFFCPLFYFKDLYSVLSSYRSFGDRNSDPLYSRASEFFLGFVSIPLSYSTWRRTLPMLEILLHRKDTNFQWFTE